MWLPLPNREIPILLPRKSFAFLMRECGLTEMLQVSGDLVYEPTILKFGVWPLSTDEHKLKMTPAVNGFKYLSQYKEYLELMS